MQVGDFSDPIGPSDTDRSTGREVEGQSPRAATASAVDEAIETSCGTLMALQASLASVEGLPGDHTPTETAIRAAIELIRFAIADLDRLLPARLESQLGLGFVDRKRSPIGPRPERG